MTVRRLTTRRVDKPWGRRDLLPAFGGVSETAEPVGEIWFEDPDGGFPPLLVKYLFTSEKLSIQVHPDDDFARARGHRSGKDEAWVVLAAEEGSSIGLGLRAPAEREAVRAAALDGSIEEMIDWRPAQPGDVYYSPAGTIHSLGSGLKLIEVQQNVDLTYRLYDFGRPRELHLEEGIATATPAPYEPPFEAFDAAPGRRILAAGGKFVLERWNGPNAAAAGDGRLWLIPVEGGASFAGHRLELGEVWIAEGEGTLRLDEDADLLLAYEGSAVRDGFAQVEGR